MARIEDLMEVDKLSFDCTVAKEEIRRMIRQAKAVAAQWQPRPYPGVRRDTR